jgi:hypothetical protein
MLTFETSQWRRDYGAGRKPTNRFCISCMYRWPCKYNWRKSSVRNKIFPIFTNTTEAASRWPGCPDEIIDCIVGALEPLHRSIELRHFNIQCLNDFLLHSDMCMWSVKFFAIIGTNIATATAMRKRRNDTKKICYSWLTTPKKVTRTRVKNYWSVATNKTNLFEPEGVTLVKYCTSCKPVRHGPRWPQLNIIVLNLYIHVNVTVDFSPGRFWIS